MISIREIRALASEWGIPMTSVEKDYVLNWILHTIASDSATDDSWIFKGGTSIKKVYTETWRFSDQMMFAVTDKFPKDDQELEKMMSRIMQITADKAGIEFSPNASVWSVAPDGSFAQGRITFRSITAQRPLVSIPFYLENRKRPVDDPVQRSVQHAFGAELPSSPPILSYSLGELFIESILGIRDQHAGSLYDAVHLFWREELPADPHALRAILTSLSEQKSLGLLTELETTILAKDVPQMEGKWEQDLKNELWKTPPFAHYRDAVPLLFAWLRGDVVRRDRAILLIDDDVDVTWQPPATLAYWGFGVPLESIRFAATNHLCIQLQYGGTKRLIEPYALRLTLDGNLILTARRADTGNPRSYRVDRMESVWVTDIPFEPVYKIEMGSIGPIRVQPTVRSDSKKQNKIVA